MIVTAQFKLDIGITLLKTWQPLRQIKGADHQGHADPQQALSTLVPLCNGLRSRLYTLKNIDTGCVVLLARPGKTEAAGVAVDQLNTQFNFKLLQLPRDRRMGGIQTLCGGREPPGFDDATKGAHGRQLIHETGGPKSGETSG